MAAKMVDPNQLIESNTKAFLKQVRNLEEANKLLEEANKNSQTFRGLCSTAINLARANPYTTLAIVGVAIILVGFMAYYYQAQQKTIQELEQKAQNISTRSMSVDQSLNKNEEGVQTEAPNNEETRNLIRNPRDNDGSANQEALKAVLSERTSYVAKRALTDSEKENDELKKKIAALEDELAASEQRNNISEQEVEGYNKQNHDNNIVIETLGKENSDLKNKLEKTQHELTEALFQARCDKEATQELELTNNQLRSNAENYEKEIDGLKKTNDAIKAELEQEKENSRLSINRLLMQNEDQKAQVQRMQLRIQQNAEKFVEERKELELKINELTQQFQDQLAQKEDKLKEVNEAKQALETKIKELEDQVKANEEQFAAEKTQMQAQINELTHQLQNANEASERAKKEIQDQLGQKEAEMTAVNEENQQLKTELNEKAREVYKIREELNRANQALEEQAKANEELTQQLNQKQSELQSKLDESERAKEELETQVKENQVLTQQFKDQLTQKEAEIQQLQTQLNEKRTEVYEIREELNRANQALEAEVKANEELSEQLNQKQSELQSKLDESERAKEELETQVKENQVLTQQFKDQLTQKEAEIQQLQTQINEKQAEVGVITADLNKAKQALEEQAKANEELSEQFKTLKEEIIKRNEEAVQLGNEKVEIEAKFAGENQQLKTQLDEKQTEVYEIREELNIANQALEAEVKANEELSQNFQTLNEELIQMQSKLDESEGEKQDLQAQIQELTQKLRSATEETEKARQQLEAQVQELQSPKAESERIRQELEDQAKANEQSKQDLQAQIQELTQKLRSATEESEKVRQQLEAQVQELQSPKAESERIRQELEYQVKANEELKQGLETKVKENEELVQSLEEQAKANEELSQNFQRLNEDLIQIQSKLDETEGVMQVLETKIQENAELTQKLNEREELFKKEKKRLIQEMELKAEEIQGLHKKLENGIRSEPGSPNTTSRSVLEPDYGSEPPAVGDLKKTYTKKQSYSPYSHNVNRLIKSEGRNYSCKNTDQSKRETVAYDTLSTVLSTVELPIKPMVRFIVKNKLYASSLKREVNDLQTKNDELKKENAHLRSCNIPNNADENPRFANQFNGLKSGSDSDSDSGYKTFSDDESVESRESNTENNTMNLLKQIVKQNTDDVSNTEETQNFVDGNNSHQQLQENMKTPTRDANCTEIAAPVKQNVVSQEAYDSIKALVPERKISKRRTRVGTLTPRKPKNGSNAELSVMQQNVEEINVSYDDVLKSINKKIAYHNNIVGDKKSSKYDKDRAKFYLMHLNVLKGIAPFFEITAQTEDKYLYMIDFCIGAYKGISKELETMKAADNSHIRFAKHRVLRNLKVNMNTYLECKMFSTTFTEDMLKEMIKVVEVKIKACENKGKNTNGPDLQGFCNTLVDGLETSAGVTGYNKGDITRLVTENNLSDCGNNELNNNSALVNNEITSNTKVQNNPSTNNNKLGKTGLNANGNNIKTVAEVLKADQYLNKVKKSTNHNNCTDSKKNSDVQSVKKNTDNNQENNNPSPLLLLNSSNIGGTTRFTSNGKSTYTTLVGAGRSVNGIWR